MQSVEFRNLKGDELHLVWTIDRSEYISNIYRLVDGDPELTPAPFDVKGWPPGEQDRYSAILQDCFDRGGTFIGAFAGDRLVGVAVMDTIFRGAEKDQLQLEFLHVSNGFRKQGLGGQLFEKAQALAKTRGAKFL